jgi:large subunit ribosomal protein LP2
VILHFLIWNAQVIAEGRTKLASVPTGGAVATATGTGDAKTEDKKEEKEEQKKEEPEEEESDDDMGFGLFD